MANRGRSTGVTNTVSSGGTATLSTNPVQLYSLCFSNSHATQVGTVLFRSPDSAVTYLQHYVSPGDCAHLSFNPPLDCPTGLAYLIVLGTMRCNIVWG